MKKRTYSPGELAKCEPTRERVQHALQHGAVMRIESHHEYVTDDAGEVVAEQTVTLRVVDPDGSTIWRGQHGVLWAHVCHGGPIYWGVSDSD